MRVFDSLSTGEEADGTAGTSLFLFGLGIGSMIFSPLSEIPMVGMTTVYAFSVAVLVAFQLPIILSNNLATILVFRFLTGVFASPCLTLGGASIKAMYSARDQGIPMAVWDTGRNYILCLNLATCADQDTACAVGTFTAPVIGNYAAQYRGYKWPMWVLLWSASAGLVIALCFLPETSPNNILYRRARRIRRTTGDLIFVSEAETQYSATTTLDITKDTILKPIILNFAEPASFYLICTLPYYIHWCLLPWSLTVMFSSIFTVLPLRRKG